MENNDLFGGIYYINLDSRVDRLSEIRWELERMGLEGERFSAIKSTPGFIGCALSHIAVLKAARDRGLHNVMILEDDFEFVLSKETFWQEMNYFFKSGIPYDMLLLSYKYVGGNQYNSKLNRVFDAEGTAGYIINCYFYDTLIEHWEKNTELLKLTHKNLLYAVDMSWKSLMPTSLWYGFVKHTGHQRPSYSDILCKAVAYNY